MPTANIEGINIYYESHGDGFPLVLAYGLGGNTTEWQPQIPVLSQNHRLIVWDPRGHGRSDSPASAEQYTQEIFAEDLKGLLDHLAIQRAYVGGLSMGGGVATRFTIKYPDRVAALLVFDSASAAGQETPEQSRRMREEIIRLAETQGMEAVAEYSMENNPNISHTAEQGAEQREAIRQMYLSLNPVGYAHSTRMILNAVFDSLQLEGIKTPTLVLAGRQDPALSPCRFIHEKIADSKLVIIPGAGHLSNLDQPEAFNQAVMEFLTTVDRERETQKTQV
jgi:pimeloyl-ACP methyl ester carboxylesterase